MSQILTPKKEILLPSNKIETPSNNASDHWGGVTLFMRPSETELSHRKLERMQRIGEIRAYYLRNPIKFMEDVFGAVLFDAQKYCVAASWSVPNVLWVCTRGYGKSSVVDLDTMAKVC